MTKDEKVKEFISSSDKAIAQWISLLNYFNENKSILSLHQLELLEKKSEEHRNYWNSERIERKTITRASGEIQHLDVVHPGLEIARSELTPDIYQYVENRRLEEQIEERKEKIKYQPVSDPNLAPALAA